MKICKLHFKTNQAVISLKYGYSVIQIRNTMHYGIDSSNLNTNLLTFKEEYKYKLIKLMT